MRTSGQLAQKNGYPPQKTAVLPSSALQAGVFESNRQVIDEQKVANYIGLGFKSNRVADNVDVTLSACIHRALGTDQ